MVGGGRRCTALLLVLFLIVLIAFTDVAHNVNPDVHIDALQLHTRSHACSSARSVVPNACACRRVFMGTNRSVPATTTGRLRKANPSVLEDLRGLIDNLYKSKGLTVSSSCLCSFVFSE
ncbi:hypothetical protein L1987_74600 [Smallanthus sonchifolius]|uniref:Uncharacterized protein n=1 Tax=Smallanthus sonchifolius TaxID=185202 RepID=A0ACB9A3H7_9ASTR|nr:hypothetical protein L1987_74600 [Smallanthus sonchifolius]